MRHTTLLGRLALVSVLTLAAGCLYRMPVQQGNVLNPDHVAQLETGMTRSQVMFLLGTPMVPNGFDTDRWDYYYFVNAGRKSLVASQRLTVWFKDDLVERFEGNAATKPAVTPAEVEAVTGS